MKKFITSWDDGHPEDLRVAEILNKKNISAVFYVPIKNVEGREVMTKGEIRKLSKIFEIGSHTYSHKILTKISLQEAWQEIKRGKVELEQIIGKKVTKFCYPRGSYNNKIINLVKKAGFKSARKVRLYNTRTEGPNSFEEMPNFHLYKHSLLVYMAHLIKNGDYLSIGDLLVTYKNDTDLMISKVRNIAKTREFHLWGHSWELKKYNLFSLFEKILLNAT